MQPQWHDLILLALPGLIAMIVKPDWPGPAKFLVAVVVCFVAAMAELWLVGDCNLADFPGTMGKVSLLVFGSYATIWKAWKVGDKVEAGVNG